MYAGFAEKMWALCCNVGNPVLESVVYQLFLVLCRTNELNFTQLIAVTFTTVRPVARISQQGSQKWQGGTFCKYNIGCMQQPLRKKSLRHANFIHIEFDAESYTDMNAEPAEHRHLLYCNLGKKNSIFRKSLKLLYPWRFSSRFTFAPASSFMSHKLQHIKRFAIQQKWANRRYSMAIEAQ